METITPDSTGFAPPAVGASSLFEDRIAAGIALASSLRLVVAQDAVVVSLSHGGVEVAAEVARALELPLDVVVVRKIRYPGSPERVLGAVAPGYALYVGTDAGLSHRRLAIAISDAQEELEHVDRRLHGQRAPIEVTGREVVLVDDGITTGARMITATRWARTRRARRVIAAVPIAAAGAAELVRGEADLVVCLHELKTLGAVGVWYEEFPPLGDADVLRLLEAMPPEPKPEPAAGRREHFLDRVLRGRH